MTGRPRTVDIGLLGGVTTVLFAVILGVFLTAVTDSTGDAVPRPVVITLLYAVPGIVGILGASSRRRSLLVAAVLPLIPGAVLSFAGVTLIFVLPALLMLAGAAGLPSASDRSRVSPGGVATAIWIAALIVGAGWAMLLGLTQNTCGSELSGTSSCGSGLISIEGMLVGLVLLGAALVLAAWRARQPRAEVI